MTPALSLLGGAALAVLAVVALVVAGLTAARARRSRALVEQRLADSRREVGELAAQLDRLAAEVAASQRRVAVDHEYVITTLAQANEAAVQATGLTSHHDARRGAVEVLEDEVLARLAQVDTTTRLGARVADLGVRALSVGHGLRRALTQENRDRAAAAAHVARRRSRRTRRQELREARRLVRAVRAQQVGRTGDAA